MSGTPYFVHESSYVDEPCQIGEGTKIWHFSHVMANSVIGPRCNIGQNVVISPGVRLGEGCKIQNNVSLYTGVILVAVLAVGVDVGMSWLQRRLTPRALRPGAIADASRAAGGAA